MDIHEPSYALGWVAGFMEASGSFTASKSRSVYVTVAGEEHVSECRTFGCIVRSADLDRLRFVQRHLGGNLTGPYSRDKENEREGRSRRPRYELRLRKEEAIKAAELSLRLMEPSRRDAVLAKAEAAGVKLKPVPKKRLLEALALTR